MKGDSCGCDYIREFITTRLAVLKGNPAARVELVGLASDNAWMSSWVDGFTNIPPTDQHGDSIHTIGGGERFRTRARNWVASTSPDCNFIRSPLAYWYDTADVHSFERESILRAKAGWLRKLQGFMALQPLWVNEAGGPAFDDAVVGGKLVYSDTLNAGSVYKLYAEALGNRVQRYAWQCYPPKASSGLSALYTNIALFKDTTSTIPSAFRAKPSFMTYRAMTGLLKNYSAANDFRLPDGTGGGLVDTAMFAVFNVRFQSADSIGPLQHNVIWKDARSIADSVYISTLTGQATDTLWVTHIALRGDIPALVDAIIGANPVRLRVTTDPYIVSSRQAFTVWPAQWGTTAVEPRNGGREPYVTAAVRPDGRIVLQWSLAAASSDAHLRIFDVMGRMLRAFEVGRRNATSGTVSWDTRTPRRALPGGVYFVALETEAQIRAVNRFVVLR